MPANLVINFPDSLAGREVATIACRARGEIGHPLATRGKGEAMFIARGPHAAHELQPKFPGQVPAPPMPFALVEVKGR